MSEEIVFELEKATKNTYRFSEVTANGQPPKVRNIYIQKWVFAERPPEKIKVTIEEL
jgi:hypothetical protein